MKKQLLCLCCCLLLSGCMEARELKERTIIEAVGIDRKDGAYEMIFQQYQPTPDQKDGSASGESKPVQSDGRSISEAIDKVTHYNGNEVFLGNSTYIVLGSDMAREGILQELHYFNGENEISPSTYLVVADGSAGELLNAQSQTKAQTSSAIRDILEQGQKNGVVGQSTIMDVMKRLVGDSTSPYLPVVSKIGEGEEAVFKVAGMAVFDREKMVDILDVEEAKGVLWANDEVKRALLVVEDEQLGLVSTEIQKSKTWVKTQLQDGIPQFQLHVDCSGRILEVIGSGERPLLPEEQKQAAQVVEQEIQKRIQEVVQRCFTEGGCDIFRFCDQVKRRYPQYWKQIQKYWPQLMPQCGVSVTVDCSLAKTGQQAAE